MSGKETNQGIIYQGFIAVLNALEEDWDELFVEYPSKKDKVDIALRRGNRIWKAIQVKSTVNSFGKRELLQWIGELLEDGDEVCAREYELYAVGNVDLKASQLINALEKYYRNNKTTEGLDHVAQCALKEFGEEQLNDKKVVIKPFPFDLTSMEGLTRDALSRFLHSHGFRSVSPDKQSLIIKAMVTDVTGMGALKKSFTKDEFIRTLKKWLLLFTKREGITLENRSIPYDIDVEEIEALFVETKSYLEILEKLNSSEGIVLVTGEPGIGKTISSQKAALYYAELGYSILYSDNGNMSWFPNILPEGDPDEKRIILLNDYFGQSRVRDSDQGTHRLRSLLNYVKKHKNTKLIINSRITVYHEAIQDQRCHDMMELKGSIISKVEFQLDFFDKARILFSHLKKSAKDGIITIPHWNAIRDESFLMQIVVHNNYMPRIIKYVTADREGIRNSSPEEYGKYIMQKLDYPEVIWKDEIKNLEQEERVFLFTLYSLTDTTVSRKILRECFEKRLTGMELDSTRITFDRVLERLSASLVKVVVTEENEERICVLNPSINDYLAVELASNRLEIKNIMKYALYIEQILRFSTLEEGKQYIIKKVDKGKLTKYRQMPVFTWYDSDYYEYIQKIVCYLKCIVVYADRVQEASGVIVHLLEILLSNTSEFQLGLFREDLSEIYRKLFTEPAVSQNDFSVLLAEEGYVGKILASAEPEEFWEIWSVVSKKYFADDEEKRFNRFQPILVDQIGGYAIDCIYKDVMNIVQDQVSDHLQYDDDDGEIADEVREEIYEEIYDLLRETIEKEVEAHDIDSLSIDDFDLDELINEGLDLEQPILDTYDKESENARPEVQENNEKRRKLIFDMANANLFEAQ